MSSVECPKCRAGLPTPAPASCPACGAALVRRALRVQPVVAKARLAKPRAEEEAPADKTPVFDVRDYKATPGASFLGILTMGVVGMVSAGLVGALGSSIGQFFYLIVVFPLVMGFAVGAAMMVAAKQTKMHSPGLAALLGLWCGVLTALTIHLADYLWNLGQLPPGVKSFPEFMDWEATEGVRLGMKGGGFNLGYTGSFVYWGVEMLVIAGVVLAACAGTAGAPFCTGCNVWKDKRRYGPFHANAEEADELLKAGKLAWLARDSDDDMDDDDPPDAYLELAVHVCPQCQGDGDIDIELKAVRMEKKEKKETGATNRTYPGEALPWLKRIAPRITKG